MKHYIKHKLNLIKQDDLQKSSKSKIKSESSNLDFVAKKFTNDLNLTHCTITNNNNIQYIAGPSRKINCDYCNQLKSLSSNKDNNTNNYDYNKNTLNTCYTTITNNTLRPISIRSKISQQKIMDEFLVYNTLDANNNESNPNLDDYKHFLNLIRSVSDDNKEENDINMEYEMVKNNETDMTMIDDDLSSVPSRQMNEQNIYDSDIGENELFERKYPVNNNKEDSQLINQMIPPYYSYEEYKIDSTLLTNTLTTPSTIMPFHDTTFSTGMMSESQQKQLDKLMVVRKKQCLKMRKILNAHSYIQCSALDDTSVKKLMEEALLVAVNYHNNKLNNNNSLNNTITSSNPLISFSEKLKSLKRADSVSRSSRKNDADKIMMIDESNNNNKKIQRKSSLNRLRCLSCTAAVSRSETMTSMASNNNK